MKKIFLVFLVVLPLCVYAEPKPKSDPVDIKSDKISYLHGEGKIVARGNVVITNKDTRIFCQEAVYDHKSNTASIKGKVKIVKPDGIINGEDIIYDFNADKAISAHMRMESSPFYGEAQRVEKIGKEKVILHKGHITTCDLSQPHYRLESKKLTIYPGERVVARNVVLKVGDLPIFYIPYYSHRLDKTFPYEFYPGKTNEWGRYMLGRYRYNFDNGNKGRLLLDWYEDRGWGMGFMHKFETKNFGEGLLDYYRIEDKQYALEKRGGQGTLFSRYPERFAVAPKYLEDDRYRVQFSYDWKPKPDLSILARFNKFSDKYFLKDFFHPQYKVAPEVKSYALITKALPSSSVSLRVQKRANRFWGETQYMPQIEYNFYRQNVGTSKFYFRSEDKIGILNIKPANSSYDDTAFRFYSHNTLNYADSIKWLNINPYVGYYSVFYSRRPSGINNTWRLAGEFGATLSTKVYKYFDAGWNLFGERIDKMRHVLTPEVSYSYRQTPRFEDSDVYSFDGNDSLSRSETVTFTLRNKLQARNKDRTWDFIYFSPSFDYNINRKPGGSAFGSVSANLEMYPTKDISTKEQVVYDPHTRRITSFNSDISFTKMAKVFEEGEEKEVEKYSLSLGHRYVRQSSSEGTLDFTYRLSPKLQLNAYMVHEYNTQTFERQQYSIRADLHCWWMDLGVDVNEYWRGGQEYNFWVVFRLKAFPDLHVEFDKSYDGAKEEY